MRSNRAAMAILLLLGAVAPCGGVARAEPTQEVAGNLPLRGAVTVEAPLGGDLPADAISMQAKRIVAAPMGASQTAGVSPSHSIASAKPPVAQASPAQRSEAAVSEPEGLADTNGELDVDETSDDVDLIGGPTPERQLKQGMPEGLLRGGSDDGLRPQGTGAWRLLVDDNAAYVMPKVDGRALLRDRAPQSLRLFARRKPNREFPASEVALSVMALLAVVFGRSMLASMRRRKVERGLAY
ncbi:MAG: hypothetical protein ABL996_11200 [Micropepsaceae bacterium]